jgi:hypothetical protein
VTSVQVTVQRHLLVTVTVSLSDAAAAAAAASESVGATVTAASGFHFKLKEAVRPSYSESLIQLGPRRRRTPAAGRHGGIRV